MSGTGPASNVARSGFRLSALGSTLADMREKHLRYTILVMSSLALSLGVACSGSDGESSAGTGGSAAGPGTSEGGTAPMGGGSSTGGSSSTENGGMVGATGGAAALGAPTPGLPRGAISFSIPSGCRIQGGYIDAPSVSGADPVTNAGATAVITNGDQLSTGRANVSCSYLGNNPVNANVSINSSAGGISFDSRIPLTVGQPSQCGLAVAPAAGQSATLGAATVPCSCTTLSEGNSALLVRVTCSDLEGDGESCPMTEGFIYFDGCG